MQRLQVFDGCLAGHQLAGEGLRCLLVLRGLDLIAGRPSLVSEDERLACRVLHLLDFTQLASQAHLELTPVAEDGRSLLGQRLMLALRVVDRLLDLDLRIGLLIELLICVRVRVAGHAPEEIRHGMNAATRAFGLTKGAPDSPP